MIDMNKIEEFYEKTRNAQVHLNVKKFIELNNNPGLAIDLGCGAGRDTVFLLKNNWRVIAIDKENTKKIIEEKLDKKEKENFKFIQTKFEEVHLDKNNLVVANFSIPFCENNSFKVLWKKIVDSIEPNRIFYWKLFWIK